MHSFHPLVAYRGKHEDSLVDVLTMALGDDRPSDVTLACTTLRPFGVQCPLVVPQLWLAPVVAPWAGLEWAMTLLGLPYRAETLDATPSASDASRLLEQACRWVADGPVIVGPLARIVIWNRLPARYYWGAAHFVLLLETAGRELLLLHDPEGCPLLRIAIERLTTALCQSHFPVGILQLQGMGQPVADADAWRILRTGIAQRFELGTSAETGAVAIHTLATRLAAHPLKASERASLRFALPHLSLSLWQLGAFLHTISPRQHEWQYALTTSVQRYQFECGRALAAMAEQDDDALTQRLHTLAACEAQLDMHYRYLPNTVHAQGDETERSR